MKNLIRLKDSRAVRLAASAVAVAAVMAGAVGLVAGQGNAAPPNKADGPSKNTGPEHAKLEHGLLKVKGTRASDAIALRLKAGDPGTLQVDFGDDGSADFSFARTKIAKIAVDARAGDDRVRIDDSNGAFTDAIPTAIDGGDGNDTIAGGNGIETLLGGDGNDSVDGNGGNDLALLGAGNDTFVWDPGDGSDTFEGQAGSDTMVFNGAGADERVALSANGNRLRFLRSPAAVTMDTNGVETVDFNALGGVDIVFVDDLTGTDVDHVNVDLAGSLGGVIGDGATDRVSVSGTTAADAIGVDGDPSSVTVSGLSTVVAIQHQDPTDVLDVQGLGGDDAISAAPLAAQSVALVLDG